MILANAFWRKQNYFEVQKEPCHCHLMPKTQGPPPLSIHCYTDKIHRYLTKEEVLCCVPVCVHRCQCNDTLCNKIVRYSPKTPLTPGNKL